MPLPLLLLLAAALPDAAPAVDFQREIQPILARHCTRCHGPAETEAGLNLTRQASVLGELESGERAIVAGDPEQSELWQRIRAEDASERMPPEGDPLSKEQKELIHRWILQGASWQEHWAFLPREPQTPPAVENKDAVGNPIDNFVLARLKEAGLAAAPPADKRVLIRAGTRCLRATR